MAERTISIVIEVDGAGDAVSQVRQMRSALDDLGGGAESLGRVVEQSREATQVIKDLGGSFDLLGRHRDMAQNLDDFFRRITSGARNAADVFKNIWREVADYFEGQLGKMAAAAAVSLGGGILFGSGGGLSGLGLAGLGGGSSSSPTLASVFGLPATTPFGDVLSQLNGIGPFSGGQVALGGLGLFGLAMGAGNPVLRGLGSVAGGALTGFSVGGPIGAIFGGILGGIASLFGGDKKKEHDTAVENAGFQQIKLLLDEYQHFRIDYENAFEGFYEIHQQMQAAFQRSESKKNEQYWFDQYVRQIQGIEDERNRRRELLSLMPVPEFDAGGFVRASTLRGMKWSRTSPQFASGGEVPAILHAGEFVMNRQAVDRWGVSVLEGLNSGSGISAGGGVSISIDPDGAKWLEQNSAALEKGIAVILRRGGNVSRALRA